MLLDEDLKEFNVNETDLERKDIDVMLNAKREVFLSKEQKSNTEALALIKKEHDESFKLKNLLLEDEPDLVGRKFILNFLQQINPSATVETPIVKTLVLMDATGSMTSLLQNSKNAVGTMFEQIKKILKDNGLDENGFMI